MHNVIEQILNKFSELDQVQAIVLSGSTQNTLNDKYSDYDIYVYSTFLVPIELRQELAERYSSRCEINNQFWEDGDEWVINGATNIDIMYRNCEFPKNHINWVFNKHNANVGFTTCILYNILNSKILFDRNNWFESMQEELNKPYPEELIKAVINKNYPILKNNISSYICQMQKALKRNDLVNLNNRKTAFINSYFDILFAINKQFHPGEKRLVQLAKEKCSMLPHNFESNIDILFNDNQTKSINIESIYFELEKLLKANGMIKS